MASRPEGRKFSIFKALRIRSGVSKNEIGLVADYVVDYNVEV
jgi:hypothetical protein